jgi:hypothetical protein
MASKPYASEYQPASSEQVGSISATVKLSQVNSGKF